MEWIEIIEIRSSESNRRLLETLLAQLIENADRFTLSQTIKIYTRPQPYADFGIHLKHNSEDMEPDGSPLGLQIVSALKPHGIIKHTTWIKVDTRS